jgi:hypothetical protein
MEWEETISANQINQSSAKHKKGVPSLSSNSKPAIGKWRIVFKHIIFLN